MSEAKIEIKRMKLSELRPADYNPRKITDEAFEGLGNSIERFGLLANIVWNRRSGNIVGGHQRFKHLLAMGEVETDVVVVDLDDNDEVALNITLNNKEIMGDFTEDVIRQLRTSEAQLGSAFKQVGLMDLFEYLKNRGFDKKTKEKDTTVRGGGGEPEPSSGNSPKIVVTCPKCHSRWALKNNEIIFNSVKDA